MKVMYIDIGSSTVKVYGAGNYGAVLKETKSLPFKNEFSPEVGLSEKMKQELIDYVNRAKGKYKPVRVKVFATAIFRRLTRAAYHRLADDFFEQTGTYFNVVPHELESFYLEKALSSEYTGGVPLLLINIGGGSTELIVKEASEVVGRYNLEIGVGTVLNDFPFLNEAYSKHALREVVDSISKQLPGTKLATPVAIYNGGELTYMRLAGYNLATNDIFSDPTHPCAISSSDFVARNEEIYQKISIKELENLMPDDPLWMHGARACSAIAQAIVEKFQVEKLVPSDSNMIDGAIKQEYRSVVLTGSYRKYWSYISKVKQNLLENGVKVLSPRYDTIKNPGADFIEFEGEENMSPLEIMRYHLSMIGSSDALIVCDVDGYVGASTLMEIGYAHGVGKRIIFTEKPEEYSLQIMPAEIGL